MKALPLAIALLLLPATAYADDGPRATPMPCHCVIPPDAQLMWLGPELGLWYVGFSPGQPIAVNPITGQVASVVNIPTLPYGLVPGAAASPYGSIYINPSQTLSLPAYLATVPPGAAPHINLYHPTGVQGPADTSLSGASHDAPNGATGSGAQREATDHPGNPAAK